MKLFPSWLKKFRQADKFGSDDTKLEVAIKQITGRRPRNIELYRLAFTPAGANSVSNVNKLNNERLEFLGDAVIGMVVAEYLFKKYPLRNEGFLTQVRSRIVNREHLNELARKIGIDKLAPYIEQGAGVFTHKSLHGDLFEAFVGAIYLDRGYKQSKKFLYDRVLTLYLDVDNIAVTDQNFKSKLIEWAQRNGKSVEFKTVAESGKNHNREFVVEVFLSGQNYGRGFGQSKKKAEQLAASKACEALNI